MYTNKCIIKAITIGRDSQRVKNETAECHCSDCGFQKHPATGLKFSSTVNRLSIITQIALPSPT